jgi:hypothetical protein
MNAAALDWSCISSLLRRGLVLWLLLRGLVSFTAGTTHWLGTPADAQRHWQFSREYLVAPPAAVQGQT